MEIIIDTSNNRIVKGPCPDGELHTNAVGRRVVGYFRPPIDPLRQRYGDKLIFPDRIEFPVVDLSEEEIAANLAAGREAAVSSICAIAKDLIETELNPLGGFKVMALAQAGKVRAGEVAAWVEGRYMDVEIRKAEVYAGLWDDDLAGAQDLSWIGKKPWTVAQVMAEV